MNPTTYTAPSGSFASATYTRQATEPAPDEKTRRVKIEVEYGNVWPEIGLAIAGTVEESATTASRGLILWFQLGPLYATITINREKK